MAKKNYWVDSLILFPFYLSRVVRSLSLSLTSVFLSLFPGTHFWSLTLSAIFDFVLLYFALFFLSFSILSHTQFDTCCQTKCTAEASLVCLRLHMMFYFHNALIRNTPSSYRSVSFRIAAKRRPQYVPMLEQHCSSVCVALAGACMW